MKICLLLAFISVGVSAQTGDPIHKPNALRRAFAQQEQNQLKLYPDLRNYPRSSNPVEDHRIVHLQEVVRVGISKTQDEHRVVITLEDVDGNTATIWTNGENYENWMGVTSISPY